jgi:hypothetical protein
MSGSDLLGGYSIGDLVAGAGDVNGDGYDDVIAADVTDGARRVRLNLGPDASAYGGDWDWTSTSVVSIAGVGDVNADGSDDILLGGMPSAHRATLWLGDRTDPLEEAVTLRGSSDYAGNSVSGAGDLNGDGVDDLLIGAWAADSGGLDRAGAVYVVFGGAYLTDVATTGLGTYWLSDADATLLGTAEMMYLGRDVSDAGDVDGDGYADIIVATSDRVYLITADVSGDVEVDSSSAEATLLAGDSVRSLTGAGDLNGDGFSDLAVGARLERSGWSGGTVYIVYGRVSGTIDLTEDADGQLFGEHASHDADEVDGAGDLDEDGLDDLIIGAWDAEYPHGAAYIVYGR